MKLRNFLIVIIFSLLSILMTENIQAQQSNISSGRETLIDVTNKTAGTYRYAYTMGVFRNLSLQIECSGGVTVTFWATNDPTASTTSDSSWVDITELVFGDVSLIDSNAMYFIDTKFLVYKFMIKYEMADNTNNLKVLQIRY